MRNFVSVLAAFAAACGSGSPPADSKAPGPALVGFSCGGVVGYSCPPDSACPICDEADCGGQCFATKACDPGAPVCAEGFMCDPGTRHCVPKRTCTVKAECDPGQLCVTQSLSKGLCLTVAAGASTPCVNGACTFPRQCRGTGAQAQCRLPCIGPDRECPAPLRCVSDLTCEP